MIIGLVGEKLSGKDTAAEYFATKHGAKAFKLSLILDEILNILNLPISRENEINLGMGLRQSLGQHVLVNALGNRLRQSKESFFVVNGIRMDELEIVRGWGAKILYLTAPVEIRFERYNKRKEKKDDGILNLSDFKQADLGVTEKDIPELGKRADVKIENIGTLENLYADLDRIVKTLA